MAAHVAVIYDSIVQYSNSRKQWFKAFDLVLDIVIATKNLGSREKDIYKTQFVLNYLNRKENQKYSYVKEESKLILNH